jgi:hypothetical protein
MSGALDFTMAVLEGTGAASAGAASDKTIAPAIPITMARFTN